MPTLRRIGIGMELQIYAALMCSKYAAKSRFSTSRYLGMELNLSVRILSDEIPQTFSTSRKPIRNFREKAILSREIVLSGDIAPALYPLASDRYSGKKPKYRGMRHLRARGAPVKLSV